MPFLDPAPVDLNPLVFHNPTPRRLQPPHLLQQFGIYVGLIVFCAVLLSLGMRALTIVTQLVGSRGQKPFLGGRGGRAGKGAMGGCGRGMTGNAGSHCVSVLCGELNNFCVCIPTSPRNEQRSPA